MCSCSKTHTAKKATMLSCLLNSPSSAWRPRSSGRKRRSTAHTSSVSGREGDFIPTNRKPGGTSRESEVIEDRRRSLPAWQKPVWRNFYLNFSMTLSYYSIDMIWYDKTPYARHLTWKLLCSTFNVSPLSVRYAAQVNYIFSPAAASLLKQLLLLCSCFLSTQIWPSLDQGLLIQQDEQPTTFIKSPFCHFYDSPLEERKTKVKPHCTHRAVEGFYIPWPVFENSTFPCVYCESWCKMNTIKMVYTVWT